MYKCMFGDDDSKAKGKAALAGSIKPILEGLERVLERKKSGGAFFFSTSCPTLADLAVYNMVESPFPGLKKFGVDVTPHPKVCAVIEAVRADLKVSAYYSRAAP